MPDVIITEFMDEGAIREGFVGYDVLYDPKLVDRPDELSRIVSGARALIVRNRTQVRSALIDSARNLRAVGRLGVGLDNIDVQACEARGIKVLPATGANDVSVAEYVICTAMMLLRGAFLATPRVIGGSWPRNDLIGRETAGRVMGLVGFGSIARETANRAAALGMRVVAYDPYAPDDAFATAGVERREFIPLLSEADVVSLHVPLTDATRGMINAERISGLRKGAVLINAARGGVVEEAAVAESLRTGHLGGAALDVFSEEPLSEAAAAVFADVPNLVLTPHIAGVTEESNTRVSWVTVENVRRVLSA
jgi:(S)-sulfolactate dehydrogenase